MILGESTDRWFWSEDVDVAVDFCVRALRHDGLRVPPFDRHPDGDGSLRALGLDTGSWRRWLDAVLERLERLDAHIRQPDSRAHQPRRAGSGARSSHSTHGCRRSGSISSTTPNPSS